MTSRTRRPGSSARALARLPSLGLPILLLRGERVLLDADLAGLYGVTTSALVQAVRRNPSRFPPDFAFRLTPPEYANLKSQFVISSYNVSVWGGRRHAPYAFTEHGVAMLSSVLKSERAVRVNVEIMRAFVRLRRALATHADLARRLDALEHRYDRRFRDVFDAIRALMDLRRRSRAERIGFRAPRASSGALPDGGRGSIPRVPVRAPRRKRRRSRR